MDLVGLHSKARQYIVDCGRVSFFSQPQSSYSIKNEDANYNNLFHVTQNTRHKRKSFGTGLRNIRTVLRGDLGRPAYSFVPKTIGHLSIKLSKRVRLATLIKIIPSISDSVAVNLVCFLLILQNDQPLLFELDIQNRNNIIYLT